MIRSTKRVSRSQSISDIWHDNQHCGNLTHGHWRLPSSGLGTNPDGHLLPLCFAGESYTHLPVSDELSLLLISNPAFQVAVERLQALLNHCSFCHLPGSCFGHPTLKLFMLVELEAAPSPSGRRLLRSGSTAPPSVNWAKRSLACSSCMSPKVFPCGNDTFLNGQPLVCDQLLHICTSMAVVCVTKLLKVSPAHWRSSHLPKFGHQSRKTNCRMWLQHRRSDPNSAAIVFKCIWC